jgi:hypothetical protein
VVAAVCGTLAFGACKTTDERPPTVTLPSRSESRTPIYDSLSPPDRDEADRVLRGCRDTGGGCSEGLLQLDTGQPVPMAVAEGVCGDGRADVCARLALLHLRGVARGTSRDEGLRLLDVACQSRLAEACLNLALNLGQEPGTEHRDEIQRLVRYACGQGLTAGCALEEEPPTTLLAVRGASIDGGVAAVGTPLTSGYTATLLPGQEPGTDQGSTSRRLEFLTCGHELTPGGGFDDANDCMPDEDSTTAVSSDEEAPPPAAVARRAADGGTPTTAAAETPGRTPVPLPSGKDLPALLAPGRLLLLGAVYGTREAPDDLARLVHASAGIAPTVVGLEVAFQEADRLRKFLRGPGDARSLEALLLGRFWLRPYQDGRSSQAVLRMLLQVRADIAQGLPLAAVPIDLPLQGDAHIAAFADSLAALQRSSPKAVVIALLGNRHAARVALTLRQRGVSLVSVDLAHDGGEAWMCQRESGAPNRPGEPKADRIAQLRALTCAESRLPGMRGNFRADSVPSIVYRSRWAGRRALYAANFSKDGFDFVYPLGAVSASRPAVPEKR